MADVVVYCCVRGSTKDIASAIKAQITPESQIAGHSHRAKFVCVVQVGWLKWWYGGGSPCANQSGRLGEAKPTHSPKEKKCVDGVLGVMSCLVALDLSCEMIVTERAKPDLQGSKTGGAKRC
jgi:hypothetical protein